MKHNLFTIPDGAVLYIYQDDSKLIKTLLVNVYNDKTWTFYLNPDITHNNDVLDYLLTNNICKQHISGPNYYQLTREFLLTLT